jgi:hypothetical protein
MENDEFVRAIMYQHAVRDGEGNPTELATVMTGICVDGKPDTIFDRTSWKFVIGLKETVVEAMESHGMTPRGRNIYLK